MASTSLSSGRLLTLLVVIAACAPTAANTGVSPGTSVVSDTLEARRLFEENIDAIHTRDRARDLATYLHTNDLARGVSILEKIISQ